MTEHPQAWSQEDEAPRRRILRVLALGLTVGGTGFALIAFSLWLWAAGTVPDILGGAVLAAAGLGLYFLTRSGHLRVAGFLVVAFLALFAAFFTYVEGSRNTGLLLFCGAVVFADFLIGGHSGLVVAAIETAIYGGIGLAHQVGVFQVQMTSPFFSDLAAVAGICFSLALAAGVFTREIRQSLHRAWDREAALQAAAEERSRLLAELQAREEAQRHLLEAVRELGNPAIPLVRGVIGMPIVGAVDHERAGMIRRSLLAAVAEHRAHTVLLDITAVPVVDTVVASALIQTMNGVRLMGARPILTGIRAEVAQTIVALGIDLAGVDTRATLEEGLASVLEESRL